MLFTQHYSDDEIMEHQIGGACSIYARKEKYIQICITIYCVFSLVYMLEQWNNDKVDPVLKDYIMNVYEDVEVRLHGFLTLPVEGPELPASSSLASENHQMGWQSTITLWIRYKSHDTTQNQTPVPPKSSPKPSHYRPTKWVIAALVAM
jgi:hypothetical protein